MVLDGNSWHLYGQNERYGVAFLTIESLACALQVGDREFEAPEANLRFIHSRGDL